MSRPYVRLISFLPEATILLVLGFAGFALSGLGSRTPSSVVHAALLEEPAPPVPLPAARPSVPSLSSIRAKIDSVIAAEVTKPERVEHAKELLGRFYNRSVVRTGEEVAQVSRFVRERTERALRPKYKKYARVIADTVLSESKSKGFDPMFLLAVIENESSFDPHVVGGVGEIGLMQITPATGAWIAKKHGIPYKSKKSLRDPKTNIRIGAAYLAQLRETFDFHGQLYLAAYNMGARNVNRALDRSIWPKDYARAVMRRYIRYYTHLKTELRGRLGEERAQSAASAKASRAS